MDQKLKHLEFIQGVVNRLSTNSFLLKGWSVVLVSALFALSAGSSKAGYVFLAYVPALVFWALDGYFLAVEREYRKLYDTVRTREPGNIDFSMSTHDFSEGLGGWASAFLSKTLVAFHCSLLGAILIVTFIQA